MLIPEELSNICGFEILPRQTNYLSDCIERKDQVFSRLASLYFSSPPKFKKIKSKINSLLKFKQNETLLALAGYIYYMENDFKKAKKYFLEAVSLNPSNLDNWMDLAFTLRHNGEYQLSRDILFNFHYVVYYYKYLKLAGCNYARLKKIVSEIAKHANGVF